MVTDGNFKADHVMQKRPDDDVPLTAGEGMCAEPKRYHEHLKLAQETKEVCHFSLLTIKCYNRYILSAQEGSL
jgi:hypothetical protein